MVPWNSVRFFEILSRFFGILRVSEMFLETLWDSSRFFLGNLEFIGILSSYLKILYNPSLFRYFWIRRANIQCLKIWSFLFLYSLLFSILFWNLLRISRESWTCQESHMVSGGFSIKTKYSFLIWLHIENKVNIVTKVAAGWQGNLRNQLRLFSRDHRDAIRFGHRDSAFIEIMRKRGKTLNFNWTVYTASQLTNLIFNS